METKTILRLVVILLIASALTTMYTQGGGDIAGVWQSFLDVVIGIVTVAVPRLAGLVDKIVKSGPLFTFVTTVFALSMFAYAIRWLINGSADPLKTTDTKNLK